MNGEDNISSSFICKWSVTTHTEMPYNPKELTIGQDSAHFAVHAE